MAAKNGVVCSLEPHHLEGEHLLAEVSCCAEAYRQIGLAKGLDSLPRRNAVEWRLAGAKPVQSDPHELQSVGVHDVEAAASVHEHLEKRVLPMMGSTTSGYRPGSEM